MPSKATINVSIGNRLGLHARPAMLFVELASRFACEIRIGRADGGGEMFDGKSIMQVMMLAATQGTEVVIDAQGSDAADAAKALAELIKSGFNED